MQCNVPHRLKNPPSFSWASPEHLLNIFLAFPKHRLGISGASPLHLPQIFLGGDCSGKRMPICTYVLNILSLAIELWVITTRYIIFLTNPLLLYCLRKNEIRNYENCSKQMLKNAKENELRMGGIMKEKSAKCRQFLILD